MKLLAPLILKIEPTDIERPRIPFTFRQPTSMIDYIEVHEDISKKDFRASDIYPVVKQLLKKDGIIIYRKKKD